MQGRHVSRGRNLPGGGEAAGLASPRIWRTAAPSTRPLPARPQRPPAGARQPANHTHRTPQSRFQSGDRTGTRFRSLPRRRLTGQPQLRPPPPGPGMAASGSLGPSRSPCPGGNPGRRRRGPATGGGTGGNEVTSGRSCLRRLWKGAERGVPAAEQVPARRRLLQCPPPHCFPSKRIPAKPSPGTRKFPGATPPAAAMETAPRLPGRLARDPASAPPAPPASRATANRRRCGRGRRHLGAPGRPFPAARARCSRVPAARRGARPGLRGAGAVPRFLCKKRHL